MAAGSPDLVSNCMIVIEPPRLFFDRAHARQHQLECDQHGFQHHVANPHEHLDGWDQAIMNFFIGQPGAVVLFMRAVNTLARHCRAGCKRDRERAKIIIIRAMGRLVREGRLKRVRRRYVRVNAAEVRPRPIIPRGVPLPDAHALRAGSSAGSTTTLA